MPALRLRLPHVNPTAIFPFLTWMPRVTRASLRADAIAGFTNAAIVLPQGVAFAAIAGLPPEYGLYTAMITPIVAAMFGSSMVMISGPTTAISAVVLAAVSPIHEVGSESYIHAVLLLTVLVGMIQLCLGLARVGRLAAFVSNSVMIGFTAAAAVLIGVSQLRGALGVGGERGGSVYDRIASIFQESLSGVDWNSIVIAGVTMITVLLLARFARKLPGFLIALAIGTGVSLFIGGSDAGIATIGSLPSVFPSFSPPSGSFDEIGGLMESAMAIALIGLWKQWRSVDPLLPKPTPVSTPTKKLSARDFPTSSVACFRPIRGRDPLHEAASIMNPVPNRRFRQCSPVLLLQ